MLKNLEMICKTMEAYFYCKYGGIKPICSDCKRNHLNSEYKTSDIKTWFTPTYIKTNGKSCTDYTPNQKE